MTAGPRKILIVEDSELLHRMYDLVLGKHRASGCQIFHAMNGRDGLDLLAKHADVDLVLLDINMPVLSGLEFLKLVKAQPAFESLQIIIISTEGAEEDTKRALANGARGYITKPFKPSQLLALIERIFAAEKAATRG